MALSSGILSLPPQPARQAVFSRTLRSDGDTAVSSCLTALLLFHQGIFNSSRSVITLRQRHQIHLGVLKAQKQQKRTLSLQSAEL